MTTQCGRGITWIIEPHFSQVVPVPKGGLQRIRIINLLLVWVFTTEKATLEEDIKTICLLMIYLKHPAGTRLPGRTEGCWEEQGSLLRAPNAFTGLQGLSSHTSAHKQQIISQMSLNSA